MRTLTDTARDMADRLRLRVSKGTGYQTSNGRRRVAIADLPFYYVEGGDPSFSEGGAPGYKRRLAERRHALLFGVLALALLPLAAPAETLVTADRRYQMTWAHAEPAELRSHYRFEVEKQWPVEWLYTGQDRKGNLITLRCIRGHYYRARAVAIGINGEQVPGEWQDYWCETRPPCAGCQEP